MAYTSQQLISKAFYLSNIVARGLETVSGEQLADGMDRLNAFLTMKSADIKQIPYFTVLEGAFIPGQEKYFIPNLCNIQTFTFFVPDKTSQNSVRFSMYGQTRDEYFGNSRAEGVSALPFTWHLERCFGGANVYVYFLPQTNYSYEIVGKFNLPITDYNQDLSLIYDPDYLEYMAYGTASLLCQLYSVVAPAGLTTQMHAYEQYLKTLSPIDTTMRHREFFQGGPGISIWGRANLGRAWDAP